MEILAVRDLTFAYAGQEKNTLKDLSFSLEKGEFVTLMGTTGSGKSTLLRLLKPELTPQGQQTGMIRLGEQNLFSLSPRESACRIGFVMQRPEQQIVTDKVWHELAFGLENLGLPTDTIRRRVAEMACYFGIEDWFERDVSALSGGQKQLLSLASVMIMQPEILLLDEPTAQLDPIAASDFIATVKKLNRDLGLTVLMAEHRLEEVLPLSHKVLALKDGKIAAWGPVREAVQNLRRDKALCMGLPAAVRLFDKLDGRGPCPLTIGEGRRYIQTHFGNGIAALPPDTAPDFSEKAVEFSQVYFRYERSGPDVLRGLDMSVYAGECFCILGGNGSGKTTALLNAAGLKRPYAGQIRIFEKKLQSYKNQSLYRNCLALLPQDPQTAFLCNSVREELQDAHADPGNLPFDFTPLLDSHPYDLSGGEQQLLALVKAMGARPRLLLLDEPTKGLDSCTKAKLIEVLKSLKARGITLIAVTHDVEFAAACADRCALFFRGEIVSCAPPRPFFSGNSFYTTAANRMARGYYENVASLEDLASLCRCNDLRQEVHT